jgi:hypothetical protein
MLIDAFRETAGLELTDADGNTETLRLLPPATVEELAELEATFSAPLPDEIRAALALTKGLENPPIESLSLVDLDGLGLEQVFPHAHSIGHDGFGNYWVVDLNADSTAWGPIFYACHDPPVIAYQCATVEEFVRAVVQMGRPGPRSPVDLVHEEVVDRLWKRDPDAVPYEQARASSDALVREFAVACGPEYQLIDLRDLAVGKGFSWGRWGARTRLRRCGTHHLWAYAPPEPKPGFFAKLFHR